MPADNDAKTPGMTEERIEQQLETINDNVEKLTGALLGNEFNNHKGLVHKVDDHEMRLKSLESAWINTKLIQGVLIFLASSVAISVVAYFFSLITKKN